MSHHKFNAVNFTLSYKESLVYISYNVSNHLLHLMYLWSAFFDNRVSCFKSGHTTFLIVLRTIRSTLKCQLPIQLIFSFSLFLLFCILINSLHGSLSFFWFHSRCNYRLISQNGCWKLDLSIPLRYWMFIYICRSYWI